MTRAELVTRRTAYLTAETEILTSGQSYAIQGTQLTKADLGKIQAELRRIDQDIDAIDYGGGFNRAAFGDRG